MLNINISKALRSLTIKKPAYEAIRTFSNLTSELFPPQPFTEMWRAPSHKAHSGKLWSKELILALSAWCTLKLPGGAGVLREGKLHTWHHNITGTLYPQAVSLNGPSYVPRVCTSYQLQGFRGTLSTCGLNEVCSRSASGIIVPHWPVRGSLLWGDWLTFFF